MDSRAVRGKHRISPRRPPREPTQGRAQGLSTDEETWRDVEKNVCFFLETQLILINSNCLVLSCFIMLYHFSNYARYAIKDN